MVDQTQIQEMKTAVEFMDKTLHQIIVDGNALPEGDDKARASEAYAKIYENRQELTGQIAHLQAAPAQPAASARGAARSPTSRGRWLVLGVGIVGIVGVVSLLGYAIHRSLRGKSKSQGKRKKK